MKKTIGIISQRRAMAVFYGKIFQELAGSTADICIGAAEDDSIRSMPKADLYISSITSYDLLRDGSIREYVREDLHAIRMDVTFSKAAIDLLRTYPEGTKALLVNQNKHMTMECIAQLYHLGISNIEFYPCYPGVENLPMIGLAITVGEPDLVPETVDHAVDIGSRLPSANVICEAALRLGNAFFLESDRFKKNRNRLANIDYSLQTISSNNLTAENRLEIILNALEEGIVCVNERGTVTLINKTARKMLNVSRGEVIGRPAAEVFPELPFDVGGGVGIGEPRLLNIRGTELGVMLMPLMLEDERLGAFVTLQSFRETERQQSSLRRQQTRKSHKAGYRFEDIVGTGAAISRVREIARHMAHNDAAILIQGESGTGKGIFAQAIHNASPRAGEPFVTVNCAALADEQLETELFGSETTLPTGAVVTKTGLIECAHRGTLYLESIEYMSPRLQASLLRMLQEKEIARSGSDESIPIDVRLISSTSENMLERVRENRFQKDLYYRLNVIPLNIPTLWERRADISQLIDYFCRRLDAEFELTAQARQALIQHRWEGNVRELKNCLEYLSYTGLHTVDYEDLPQIVKDQKKHPEKQEELERRSGMKMQEYLVLKELGENYHSRRGLGRQAIMERCRVRGSVISEYETRVALERLAEMGFAEVRPGRGGSRLTEQGFLRYRRLLYGDETE